MNKLKFLLIGILVLPAFAQAEEPSLVDELDSLNAPANEAPGAIEAEKLYSVQTRYSPLKSRFEVTATAGQKVSDTGFITSRDFGGGVRYYINSRWSVGATYTSVANQLSSTANRLYERDEILPDVPYTKYRADLTARFNLFYGKFRISMDRVLYFDQYVSLGPGIVGMSNGNTVAGVADVGFAFWLGSNWSARIGVKDYIYNEVTEGTVEKNKSLSNTILVYLDVGYLFGKGV